MQWLSIVLLFYFLTLVIGFYDPCYSILKVLSTLSIWVTNTKQIYLYVNKSVTNMKKMKDLLDKCGEPKPPLFFHIGISERKPSNAIKTTSYNIVTFLPRTSFCLHSGNIGSVQKISECVFPVDSDSAVHPSNITIVPILSHCPLDLCHLCESGENWHRGSQQISLWCLGQC